MIATTQIRKGAALSKRKWIKSTNNNIWNDDQVLQERETWSDKDMRWEMNDLLASHAISNDGNLDHNELIAFSSSFRKATPEICQMDTDSFAIRFESYASRCISPFIRDFIKE